MRFMVLIAVGLVAGPASTQMPGSAPAQVTAIATAPVPTDNLIIYRAHAEPTAWSPTITVDGVTIVALPNRHYTSTNVDRGTHVVSAYWPTFSGQSDTSTEVRVQGGETHFVEVTGVWRSRVDYRAINVRWGSGIAEVTPEQGRQALASCCKFKPRKSASK